MPAKTCFAGTLESRWIFVSSSPSAASLHPRFQLWADAICFNCFAMSPFIGQLIISGPRSGLRCFVRCHLPIFFVPAVQGFALYQGFWVDVVDVEHQVVIWLPWSLAFGLLQGIWRHGHHDLLISNYFKAAGVMVIVTSWLQLVSKQLVSLLS